MITVQFQELDKYKHNATDKKLIEKYAFELEDKFPRLFSEEEVVLDVTVNQNPHTLHKKLKVIGFIPNHGKIVADAEVTTLPEALSEVKDAIQVQCKKLITQH